MSKNADTISQNQNDDKENHTKLNSNMNEKSTKSSFDKGFSEAHDIASKYWKPKFETIGGGIHGTSLSAMKTIIQQLKTLSCKVSRECCCWDIGIGYPVFAQLLSMFMGVPVLGFDTDEYIDSFGDIYFTATEKSVFDMETLYQDALKRIDDTTNEDNILAESPEPRRSSTILGRRRSRLTKTSTTRTHLEPIMMDGEEDAL